METDKIGWKSECLLLGITFKQIYPHLYPPSFLINLGVPKQDIVLGFYPPFMREMTDYAVG
ncbi:element excision factor XisI family protein [Planktothrix sp. FACHB-1365]|uniref:element excision factor XisI family protein n=1 Tax=Planktothrix sp. FACHB-1365 TaxID=2692855 RepID=UPI00272A5D73